MKRRCDQLATWADHIREADLLEFGDINLLEAKGHLYGRGFEAEGDALPSRLAEVLADIDEQTSGWEDYLDSLNHEIEELEQYPKLHFELNGVRQRRDRAAKQVAELNLLADTMVADHDAQGKPQADDSPAEELDSYNRGHWDLVWKQGFEVILQTKLLAERSSHMPYKKAVDLLHRALRRLLAKTYHLKDGKVVKHDGKLLKAGELCYPHYMACKLICVRALAKRNVSWAAKELPSLEAKFISQEIARRLLNQQNTPDSVFVRQEPEQVMGHTGVNFHDMEETIDFHRYCERRAAKEGCSAQQAYEWLLANEEE